MQIRTLLTYLVAAAAVTAASGCAHNIRINPTAATAEATAPKAKKTAGLYISAPDRAREVVSPGGGGDQISYFPYKDLEGPLSATLGRVYENVESLEGFDAKAISGKSVSIAFAPQLSTTSSSPSPFTWPPTEFSVTIKMKAVGPSGDALWEDSVTGSGKAEFEEFKADFPLAARRASADALSKLEALLRKREGLN